MRKFDMSIFWGNDWAKYNEKMLFSRLKEGIEIASGLQQPSHPDSKEAFEMDKIERKKLEEELKDIVRDIATALLDNEIEIKDYNNVSNEYKYRMASETN